MPVYSAVDNYSRNSFQRQSLQNSRAKYDNLQEPEWFLPKLKEFFGKVSVLKRYFDPNIDSFFEDTESGETVFCVPPFSQAAKYLELAADEIRKNPLRTIVFLISARTEAYSWHDHVFGKASILFIKGPFRFIGLDKGLSASLIIYGNCPDTVISKMTEMGTVITPQR